MFAVILVSGGTIAVAQLTDSDTVDITAVVVDDGPPPGPGGGGSGSPVTTVTLSGWAFPHAKLTVLKDGLISTSLIANADGSFQISLNDLAYGNYQLAIFAEDPTGNTSSSYVVNVSAFSNQPQVFNNIVIPPTIASSHLVVGNDQQYAVFGYAPAGSTVLVEILGVKFLGSVTADSQGYWQLNLFGEPPYGVYALRARASFNNHLSFYSKPLQLLFFLLQPGVPEPVPPPQLATCVDFNKDRRVNLIDFSILLFWFGKEKPPEHIDCNRDGLIDIKDFSILMYFWTG